MDNIRRIDDIMVQLFNSVLKMEEYSIKKAGQKDLSAKEIGTLAVLDVNKARIMSEVAAELRISVGTLTVSINRLVKKGYVERYRTDNDRRVVRLRLTRKGESAVRVRERLHRRMIGQAISSLTEEETERFIDSLESINRYLAMQEEPPLRKDEFTLSPVRIGDKILEKNIFQGALSPGISGAELVSRVILAGGVGTIASHGIGIYDEFYKEDPAEANVRALRREIKKVKEIVEKEGGGPKGFLAVNVMCSDAEYREYVKAACEEGADMIVAGAGLPTGLPEMCRNLGREDMLLIPIVSSVRAMKIILRSWEKKHGRLPDGFIFEGPMAGGLLGYKRDQIGKAMVEYCTLLKTAKEALAEYDIPLIAAGGIWDREDATEAYKYGADAIQLGTRFVTSGESKGTEDFKKAYLKCGRDDTILVDTKDGRLGRIIKTGRTKGDIVDRDLLFSAAKAVRGDTEDGLLFAGAKAYRAEELEDAEDIIRSFGTG